MDQSDFDKLKGQIPGGELRTIQEAHVALYRVAPDAQGRKEAVAKYRGAVMQFARQRMTSLMQPVLPASEPGHAAEPAQPGESYSFDPASGSRDGYEHFLTAAMGLDYTQANAMAAGTVPDGEEHAEA